MKKRSKKGFTLIELVVVIAILGILAAILIPVIGGFIARAELAANEANARNLYNTVAMANATGAGLTTDASDSAGEELPDPLPSMFGTVPDGDTWSFTVDTDGVVTNATYNGVVYSR